jgi:hypothetical protein
VSIALPRRAILGGLAAGLLPRNIWAQSDPLPALLDQVDASALRDTVFTLSSFPTRWTDHPAFPVVEQWMADAFTTAVTRQPFPMPSGKTRHNIIAGDPNSGREVVLIGAHFDSISESPSQLAPGANDNATGIAAMLEVHRIMAGVSTDREIVCVAFSGEEQGLLGSAACAEVAAQEGWPVAMMLNLDMLGWRPPRPDAPMVIEYDQGNASPTNDAAARAFGLRAAELAAAHTTLTTTHTDIWASDYMPFEARGVPAVGLYDGGAEGGHYHTIADTPDTVDFGRLEQATRLALAIVADTAGVPS